MLSNMAINSLYVIWYICLKIGMSLHNAVAVICTVSYIEQ